MKDKVKFIAANFLAALALFALILTPIYFARNFARVAGVKTQSQYLLVSQVEKFPEMTFSQSADIYTLTFTKVAPVQAYLSIIIINNPTNETKKYTIKNQSQKNQFFFGENLNDLQTNTSVPPGATVPISLLSESNTGQSAPFQIQVD